MNRSAAAGLIAFILLALTAGPAWPQKAKPLPRPARETMRELDQAIRSVDSSLKLLQTLRSNANPQPDQIERKVGEIDAKIDALEPLLDRAKAEAAGQGVSSHPDFDAAQAKIADAAARFAAVKGETLRQAAADNLQNSRPAISIRQVRSVRVDPRRSPSPPLRPKASGPASRAGTACSQGLLVISSSRSLSILMLNRLCLRTFDGC